jgi:hypothetical protein
VIDYKLRQEKQGGFLLDRHRGTAFQLPQPAFDLLMELFSAGDLLPDRPQAVIARHFGTEADEGWHWWRSLEEIGVMTKTGLQSLQVIPLTEDLANIPDDCLTAPARVYFELTRRCNLACHSCFN